MRFKLAQMMMKVNVIKTNEARDGGRWFRRFPGFLMPAGVIAAGLMSAAPALAKNDFGTVHEYEFKPGGNVVPIVRVEYFMHCWARVPGVNDPACPDYDASGIQSPAWHGSSAFGRSYVFSKDDIRTTKVPNTGTITVDPVSTLVDGTMPTTVADTCEALGCDPESFSRTHVNVTVNAFDNGTRNTPISGTIDTGGVVCEREGRAYGFSAAWLYVKAGREMRTGRIKWKAKIRERNVASAPRARRQRDPIEYRVTNLNTGAVTEGTLLSVYADYPLDAPGEVNWDLGVLEVTASDVDFVLEQTDPGLAAGLQGTFSFSVRGGVVIASSATGMYAGMAPPVGIVTPFNLPLPSDMTIDYDLGNFNGDPLDVEFWLGGSAEFDAGPILSGPCPGDLDGDGVVGAGDLAIVLGSWGGPNPAADLNGDGIVNAGDLALVLGAWGACP